MKSARDSQRHAGRSVTGSLIATISGLILCAVIFWSWAHVPKFARPTLPPAWTPGCPEQVVSWLSAPIAGGMSWAAVATATPDGGVVLKGIKTGAKQGPEEWLVSFDGAAKVRASVTHRFGVAAIPFQDALWSVGADSVNNVLEIVVYDPLTLHELRRSTFPPPDSPWHPAAPFALSWPKLEVLPSGQMRVHVYLQDQSQGQSSSRTQARQFLVGFDPAHDAWGPVFELPMAQRDDFWLRIDPQHYADVDQSVLITHHHNLPATLPHIVDLETMAVIEQSRDAIANAHPTLVSPAPGRADFDVARMGDFGSWDTLDVCYSLPAIYVPRGDSSLADLLNDWRYGLWRRQRTPAELGELVANAFAVDGVTLRLAGSTALSDRVLGGDLALATRMAAQPIVIDAWHSMNPPPNGRPEMSFLVDGLTLCPIDGDTDLVIQAIPLTPDAINGGKGIIRIGTLARKAGDIAWLGWVPCPTNLQQQQYSIRIVRRAEDWVLTCQLYPIGLSNPPLSWCVLPALVDLPHAVVGATYESWMGTPSLE
ncbi:MAG: hypothetical protein ABI743_03030 [bacterium]